jgi:nicotinate phosphoribosyltransferase
VRELVAWWRRRGVDPMKRTAILADGLDVKTRLCEFDTGDGIIAPMGADIADIHFLVGQETNVTYGWGTALTNDFRGCVPGDPDALKPISLVCKVDSVDGMPAVKLSDNHAKAAGDPAMVARFKRIFGSAGVAHAELTL